MIVELFMLYNMAKIVLSRKNVEAEFLKVRTKT